MTLREPPNNEPALLRHLIEQGGRVRPLAEVERRALLTQLERSLKARKLVRARQVVVPLAALASLALVVLLSLAQHPPTASKPLAHTTQPATHPLARTTPAAKERVLQLGGRGELVLSQDALVELPADLERGAHSPVLIALQRGTLSASVGPRAPDEPLSIVTPHVVVTVVGTRFSVRVEAGLSTVSVEHGRVRVEPAGVATGLAQAAARALFVDGGESVRSDDLRFERPRPAQRKRALAEHVCAAPTSRTDRACLSQLTQGRGLAAENALVALALLERDQRHDSDAALLRLREYERRFPRGRLSQEVALSMVGTLLQRGQGREACAYAAAYARRFPADAATSQRLAAGCAAPE
jgi:hypothetical protein